MPKNSKTPPPLPIPARVEVWEYLEDGIWSHMGEAFIPSQMDPFWAFLIRIIPWWPFKDDQIHGAIEDFDIQPWPADAVPA